MPVEDTVIGMMDGAYFTGRKEILEWVNETLGVGLTKIEQTCTGAISCQLLDAHFPDSGMLMSKVRFVVGITSVHIYFASFFLLWDWCEILAILVLLLAFRSSFSSSLVLKSSSFVFVVRSTGRRRAITSS